MDRSFSLRAIGLGGFLWASSAWGAAPLQLSGGINAGEFAITPDGSRVVFQSFNGTANVLYSARTDAIGSPILLSPNNGGSSFIGKFTPDSSTAIFNAYESPGGIFHVATYSNRLDGSGGAVQLNNSKVFDDDPSQYTLAVSPDGQRLAIRADQGDYDFDLLSRPINASQPAIALNENPHTGGFGDGVGNIWFAAGNRVVFSTRGGDESGLFSRAFDGSTPAVQLNPAGRSLTSFIVSGDGSKVALTADGGFGRALYSASVNGDAPTMLTGDDDNPHAFEGLWIDPHGRHAVYTTDSHLSTVPTDGSSGPKSLSPNADGYGELPNISPDEKRVAFMSKVDDSSPRELFVSPIDASAAPMKLNAVLPDGGNVNYLQYTPDGVHIVYLVSQIGGNTNELFSILADGSGAPVPLSNSGNFRIMPDGKNVIYAAGLADGSGISALYEIGIDGGKPVLLAQNPYSSGMILPWGEGWQISADGRLLVFTADDGVSRSAVFAVAIPEPGVLLLGGALLMWRRRRFNLR